MGVLNLSGLKDAYNEAEVQNFEDLPVGTYQARIVNAVPAVAERSGNPMVKWDMIVLSGDCKGRHIFMNMVLTANSIKVVKGNLLALKYTGELDDLEAALPGFINQAVEVRISAGKPDGEGNVRNFTNFRKLLDIPIEDGVDYSVPQVGDAPF